MAPGLCDRRPGGRGKTIGYYMDASDDFYKAGFEVFKTLAEREGWTVLDVVGQGTAPEQIAAVENFITQGVDALLVVQNSPETTSQTLKLAKDAGIPEFHLTHNPPNEPGLAGFAGYDWVYIGELAGKSAMERNVKKLIMIEGKLGQGTASGQTEGFLKSYAEAGKDIGNLADNVGVKGAGGKDLQVVFWGSGGWFADPAKKVMQDAITSLGPDGFDGAYVHNDEMMAGALQAMRGSRARSEQVLARREQRQGKVLEVGCRRHDHDGRERDRDAGGGYRQPADQGVLRGQALQEGRVRLRHPVHQGRHQRRQAGSLLP